MTIPPLAGLAALRFSNSSEVALQAPAMHVVPGSRLVTFWHPFLCGADQDEAASDAESQHLLRGSETSYDPRPSRKERERPTLGLLRVMRRARPLRHSLILRKATTVPGTFGPCLYLDAQFT